MHFTRVILLPLALAIGSTVFAAPGVEERNAGAPSSSTAASDMSVVVFEQIQQFRAQIEVLTGRVEQLEHDLRQAREQERARYIDLDARIAAIEKAAVAAEKAAKAVPVAAPDAVASSSTPALPAPSVEEEQALFDQALLLVREQKYDAAIVAFEQQLKRFPRGELTPTTMYWLGEMWQAATTPDVPKAGRYFYRVYNEYPKSTRASAAMYKHGLIQCLGDELAKGRMTLSRVLTQYPASADAKLADSALRQQCK